MDLFSYCYNLVYMLCFSVALSSCFTAYGVTKRQIFRQFGILLLAYLFDSVTVALFAVLHAQQAPQIFYFLVLALFTGVETAILTRCVCTMFDRPFRGPWTAIPAAALICAVCGTLLPGNLGWFLDISTFSFTLLVLSVLYAWLLRRNGAEEAGKFRQLMMLIGIFSGLSVLESVIYLAGAHEFIDRLLPVYNSHINFFADLLSLVLSAWLVVFSRREQDAYIQHQVEDLLQQRMREFQAQEQERLQEAQARERERQKQAVSDGQIRDFSHCYGLTERETEILRLLLEGRSNQEIGQLLYITTGTVKTHVHSIFGKLEVSRRGQLLNKFVNHGI